MSELIKINGNEKLSLADIKLLDDHIKYNFIPNENEDLENFSAKSQLRHIFILVLMYISVIMIMFLMLGCWMIRSILILTKHCKRE